MFFGFKVLVSALLISFTAWLSGKKPELAGFIIALPLVTLIVLPFSYYEYKDPANSVRFAQSILLAVPLSLTFFIPFLLATKWNLSFWNCYTSGFILLIISYFAHGYIFSKFWN